MDHPIDLFENGEAYLAALDLPTLIRTRVDEVIRGFQVLCGRELDRIFVSDSIDPANDEHAYASVWGFQGDCWMEARGFLYQFDMDISSYAHSIKYLGVRYENLDLSGVATKESRLSLEIETEEIRYSMLAATGLNSNALLAILRQLLIPNLREKSRR